MKAMTERINRLMQTIFGLTGTAMILIASYNVLARDVLRISAPWTDEALKFLDTWMIFIMAAVVFLLDEQISLTLIEDGRMVRSRPVVYHLMKIFQYALALLLNLEMLRELVQIIGTQISTGEFTAVIKYPLWLLNTGMLIGCALTVVFAVLKIAHQLRNLHTEPGLVE